MNPENPIEVATLNRDQLLNDGLLASLHNFYLQSAVREGAASFYEAEELEEMLLDTLDSPGGRIIIATTPTGEVCGFVGGYDTDFTQVDFQLDAPVPEGTYFYVYGLQSSTGDPSLIYHLAKQLLEDVKADYCVGHVAHNAPVYQRRIYHKRGWKEVRSNHPTLCQHSYFYIPRKEVIK